MRWRPVQAIAARDLRLQLRGRQRFHLPGLLALLLTPLALAPPLGLSEEDTWQVKGDVPEEVLAMPEAELWEPGLAERLNTLVFKQGRRVLVLGGRPPPLTLRELLDARDAPDVQVHYLHEPWSFPSRGILFALIAASTLTGSLAQSLPGERSGRTLVSLRAAAITPWEIVAGKWLAWTGFATIGALLASGVALLLGRMEPGLWVLGIPAPIGFAAALGLFLIRGARDVVGGSAAVIRVLPPVLAGLGFASWLVAATHPWIGSSIPVGGSLIVAGGLLTHPLQITLAVTTTLLPTAWLLQRVVLALDDVPTGEALGARAAWLEGAALVVLWWTSQGSIAILEQVSRTDVTDFLPSPWTLTSGAVLLAVLWSTQALRRPASVALGPPPPLRRALAGALAAFGLAVAGLPAALSWSSSPFATLFVDRTDLLAAPGAVAVGIIVLQELLVRGRLLRLGGLWPSVVLWTVAFHPFTPLFGLLTGLGLGLLARHLGDWRPGAVGRLLLLAAVAAVGAPPWWVGASALAVATLMFAPDLRRISSD